MHSHEKTLIARLGFADTDKRHSAHDEIQMQLCDDPIWLAREIGRHLRSTNEQDWGQVGSFDVSRKVEEPISKGDGKYKTTIGFIDLQLCIRWFNGKEWDGNELPFRWQTWNIEIKALPCPAAEIIRQIKLYKEYTQSDGWVIITGYEMEPSEKRMIGREGILTFRAPDNSLTDPFGDN
jgi:hypothetical protein